MNVEHWGENFKAVTFNLWCQIDRLPMHAVQAYPIIPYLFANAKG